MAGSASISRVVAYDAYTRILHEGMSAEQAIEAVIASEKNRTIKKNDRALIKEIVYGSLRWHSKIFWILQNTASRDLTQTKPPIQSALVCGTYQIFYLDRVPDRAAVNESVEYVRARGEAAACSFVNGILRQIARRAEYFAKPDKVKQPIEYLSLQFAHPEWIVERWSQRFKFEKLQVMLAANNQAPPWSVRINVAKTPLTDTHALQQRLLREERIHSDRRPLRSALRLKQPPAFHPKSLFGQGYFTIQDEAAQLISLLVQPQKGDVIVDACCGPGGKLSHIYELASGQATVVGMDKSAEKLEMAQQTMSRLGHSKGVSFHCDDFLSAKLPIQPNKILLDAPCSGLGVLRRYPEGKWHKSSEIIPAMSEMQKELVARAIELLPPGGELTYAVCSFEPEETLEVLSWLQKKFNDKIELSSPVARLPDYYKRYVTRDNVLATYAGNQDAMDGFGAFVIKVR